MVSKVDAKLALDTLKSGKVARIGKGGETLFLQPVDFGSKLHVSTLVYEGASYIPQSVRKAASHPLDLRPTITTWLSFEEELFQISLHYLGHFEGVDYEGLYALTAEFEEIAIRWRQIFEEKDRQDLVHVHHTR